MLQGLQRKMFNPLLKQLDPIIQAHFGLVPYKFKWNCIFPESSVERVERELQTVKTVVEAVEAGVISIEEGRGKLKSEKVFLDIDIAKIPKEPVNKVVDKSPKDKQKK